MRAKGYGDSWGRAGSEKPPLFRGWISYKIRADLWKYMAVALPLYLAVYGAFGLFTVGYLVVFTCVAAGLGFSHEMLRADGSEG